MGNFFAEAFIGMMYLICVYLICVISCKVIELVWMCVYMCFSPFWCPGRHIEPLPVEICKGFTHLVQYIRLRLRRCKKRVEKKKVKPIIYDNAHIIVINPYEKYQIATVSKVIN